MHHYLFYIPSFEGGGAERVAVMLANQMSSNGSKVSFAVNRAVGPYKSLLSEVIMLHELEPGSHFSSIFLFSSLLKKIKPDFAYCRLGLCPIVGVFGALLSATGCRIVISYHNLYCSKNPLGSRTAHYLVALLSRLSHCTVCVSSDIQAELRDRFKAPSRKLRVIYNPIDLDEITRKSAESLPEPFRVYEGEKLFILAVGRFVIQKDYPTLVRAFKLLSRKIPHDLLILGEGPRKNAIRDHIREMGLEDRVLLPPFQQNPYPVFRAASLFVLSSSSEGFGNVIIEALTTGTPVVSTNCPGGPKEILANGRYGKLTPVGDDQALAEAIMETIRNPLPAAILRERAGDFSLDKIASQYQSVCKDDY